MKIGKTEKTLLNSSKNGPLCFTLLDSQSTPASTLPSIIKTIESSKAAAIFIGGSTISDQMEIETFVNNIKKLTKLPVILFPGSSTQVSREADAILYLSLISGRNSQYLIGEHVQSAPKIHNLNLKSILCIFIFKVRFVSDLETLYFFFYIFFV